jgi:coiled-coil domain-containing protein 39
MTVQNDLHRLDVKRLKDLLSAKADAVFSLENRRQQLVLSMEERKTEIAVHRDVLKAELKTMQEEKHNLVMDLRNREAQIEKLKSRYDSIAMKTGADGSTDDSNHAQFQSYYIIQAAQRREELTRRGDELDFQIRVIERELRAQQLTLDHLNARNVAFRDSFKKVDANSEDAEVLKQYEEQIKLVKDNLFRKKKELQRLLTDAEEDERRLDQVKSQYTRVSRQKENYEGAKKQVEEEILTQQSQLEELNAKISTMVMKHRTNLSTKQGVDIHSFDNGTLEEKSALADVMKDCVQVSV